MTQLTGGGTGANVEFMSSAIHEGWFSKIIVLDLAPSLCEVARKRAEEKWPGVVSVVCGDACNAKEKGLPQGVWACPPPPTLEYLSKTFSTTP